MKKVILSNGRTVRVILNGLKTVEVIKGKDTNEGEKFYLSLNYGEKTTEGKNNNVFIGSFSSLEDAEKIADSLFE